MGLQIEDGTGAGFGAGVSSNNRLQVDAVQVTAEHYINQVVGSAYNLLFTQDLAWEGFFVYIKNTNEFDMVFEGLSLRTASDNLRVDILSNVIGTPAGGADITPANLNAGSAKSASGIFYAGNAITSLSGGVLVDRYYFPASDESAYFNFEQDLVVPKNFSLALFGAFDGSGDSSEVSGVLNFYISQNIHGGMDHFGIA
jgi:hypothetical protein